MGAWIEILNDLKMSEKIYVAPYMGAWIEISSFSFCFASLSSHPTWVRGLKLPFLLAII